MSALYARFAVQKNEIRRTEGVVHPKIFSPPSNLKLSVETEVLRLRGNEKRRSCMVGR